MKMLPGKRSLTHLVCSLALLFPALLASRGLAQVRADPQASQDATVLQRVGVTSAVTVGATAFALGGGVAAGLGTRSRCDENDFTGSNAYGCVVAGGSVFIGVSLTVLPVALTLGSFFTHRSLDGRGRWYAALAGTAVGMAAGASVLGMALSSNDDSGLVVGSILGGLITAAVPVLALELSHGRVLAREQRAVMASRTRVMPVASALANGGAWIGLSGTL